MTIEPASGEPRTPADLRLRDLTPHDFAFLRRLAQDERVVRYVGDGTPWSEEYLQRRFVQALEPASPVNWRIAVDGGGLAIGLLSAVADAEETEIGYWVDPEVWGRGIAGRLVAEALAATDGRLIGRVHPENAASRRVLERAGFVRITSPRDRLDGFISYGVDPSGPER